MKRLALTVNQKLAVAAVALGAVGLFGPNPYARGFVTVNVKELAARADTQADRVAPLALAELLMRGTREVQIVDLRAPAAYEAGGLPQAVNMTVPQLLADNDLRTANLLLYSQDDLQAAQAWALARTTGFTSVRVVAGGYDAWRREVLYPMLATAATPAEAVQLERRKQVSLFFGGAPRVAGTTPVAAVASPKAPAVKTPAPAAGAGGAVKKKKREGC